MDNLETSYHFLKEGNEESSPGFNGSIMRCSGDEDQAQERVDKIAKSLKSESLGSMLTAAGVGIVSCIIQRDEGRSPTRHCFHWAPDQRFYEEEPLSRHVEPPLSNLLELVRIQPFVLDSFISHVFIGMSTECEFPSLTFIRAYPE